MRHAYPNGMVAHITHGLARTVGSMLAPQPDTGVVNSAPRSSRIRPRVGWEGVHRALSKDLRLALKQAGTPVTGILLRQRYMHVLTGGGCHT